MDAAGSVSSKGDLLRTATGQWCGGYWAPTCAAYGLGLGITYLALVYSWFGDQGQPALLYLVPCTLGTALALGWVPG